MDALVLCPHVICVLCHVICSRMVATKQLKDACTVFLWISNPTTVSQISFNSL